MSDFIPELGSTVAGIACDGDRWTGKYPPRRRPEFMAIGTVVAVFPEAPGVAEVYSEKYGRNVLVRDLRPVKDVC